LELSGFFALKLGVYGLATLQNITLSPDSLWQGWWGVVLGNNKEVAKIFEAVDSRSVGRRHRRYKYKQHLCRRKVFMAAAILIESSVCFLAITTNGNRRRFVWYGKSYGQQIVWEIVWEIARVDGPKERKRAREREKERERNEERVRERNRARERERERKEEREKDREKKREEGGRDRRAAVVARSPLQ
jgi:hypothetical protein